MGNNLVSNDTINRGKNKMMLPWSRQNMWGRESQVVGRKKMIHKLFTRQNPWMFMIDWIWERKEMERLHWGIKYMILTLRKGEGINSLFVDERHG